jgi:hypothetical protein
MSQEVLCFNPSSNLHQKPQIYISKHCLARVDARSSTVREESEEREREKRERVERERGEREEDWAEKERK